MVFDFVSKLSYFPEKATNCIKDNITDSLSTVFFDMVSGICDHNCIFCDGQYNPLIKKLFTEERLLAIADEFKLLNVNSVIIVGEGGESTLHPSFCKFSKKLLDLGIHVGLYTNGETLTGEIAQVAKEFDFVRISLDSGCSITHNLVHRPHVQNAFSKIILQAKEFSKIKKGVLGASFIVLKENINEIPIAATLFENCGFDFLELKPYYAPNYTFNLSIYESLAQQLQTNYLKAISLCSNMPVILNNQFKEWEKDNFSNKNITQLEKPRICYTNKLRMVVSPTGCYLCTCFRNVDSYCMGDPNTTSLVDIWYSNEHLMLSKRLCGLKCTYDEQNSYLVAMKENRVQLPAPVQGLTQNFFL